MAFGDGKDYLLGRTALASARLNLQHYLWVQDTGYLIHPNIPVKENARIADVGTGTGVWLLDLASKFPQSQLDGYDIDLSQTPPQEWLPPNVSFRQWNATSEVPLDMVAKYDIVHIRFFLLVVQDNNPEQLLQNLLRLLKPGGWLQWSEYDPEAQTFITAKPDTSLDALKDIAHYPRSLKSTQGDPRFHPTWTPLLPEYFKSNGIEDISVDQKDQGLSHVVFTNQVHLMTCEEARLRMDAEDAQTYRGILDKFGELNKQAQNEVALTMKKWTVVGKKRMD